ncbi:MAG: YncE family protein [Anaerolineae bacterium]|nr:MAG: YncE family protein [Anaerolineae bacterium]
MIPASGRVVVANRQTANATVVDPTAGAVLQTLAAGLMPNGVIVEGGYGYIANFGSDTVTVFDPTTLAVIRTLYGVGHEPAMFASDSASGDVYLTAHGSNQVFMLRAGQVVGHWDGIPEPYGLSFDPASRRLYVANRGAPYGDRDRRVSGFDCRYDLTAQRAVRALGQPRQRPPVHRLRRSGRGVRHPGLAPHHQHPGAAGRGGGSPSTRGWTRSLSRAGTVTR